MRPRSLHIVSDLHLGGRPPDPPRDPRGFRMCSQGERLAAFIEALAAKAEPVELVIAGDFIDFLAEPDETGGWSPFHGTQAADILDRVIREREPRVFAALAGLLAAGHRLVLLLGNHDLELSLPDCRARLREALGAGPGRRVDLEFLLDDEPYVVGDALIEHGNRVDAMNAVDHGALRQARRALALHRRPPPPGTIPAPPGSLLVASQMNPLKARWPFIDLLKPETRAVPPILLALEPRSLARLLPVLGYLAEGQLRQAGRALSRGALGREIAGGGGAPPEVGDPLAELTAELPPELAQELLAATGGRRGAEIAAGRAEAVSLDLLRRLLVRLCRADRTFDLREEQGAAYRRAAEELAAAGHRVVVMGHTHMAVREPIVAEGAPPEAVYLNSGTWADLLTLPPGLFDPAPAAANAALEAWLHEVRAGRFEVLQRPTWVHLRLGADERVERAELRLYRAADPDDPANLLLG